MNTIIELTLAKIPDTKTIEKVFKITECYTAKRNKNVIIVKDETKIKTLFIWLEAPVPRPKDMADHISTSYYNNFSKTFNGLSIRFDDATLYYGINPETTITKKQVVDVVYKFCKAVDTKRWERISKYVEDMLVVEQDYLGKPSSTKVDLLRFLAMQTKKYDGRRTKHTIKEASIKWADDGVEFSCNVEKKQRLTKSKKSYTAFTNDTFKLRKIDGILKIYHIKEIVHKLEFVHAVQ